MFECLRKMYDFQMHSNMSRIALGFENYFLPSMAGCTEYEVSKRNRNKSRKFLKWSRWRCFDKMFKQISYFRSFSFFLLILLKRVVNVIWLTFHRNRCGWFFFLSHFAWSYKWKLNFIVSNHSLTLQMKQ